MNRSRTLIQDQSIDINYYVRRKSKISRTRTTRLRRLTERRESYEKSISIFIIMSFTGSLQGVVKLRRNRRRIRAENDVQHYLVVAYIYWDLLPLLVPVQNERLSSSFYVFLPLPLDVHSDEMASAVPPSDGIGIANLPNQVNHSQNMCRELGKC